ncbi:MAG TPA: DUF5666 domain-containing protein [Acidimicrobiia bacterium]|nr:DUF5666 domain-containing protein [Acidimicrobiia bacterium]
METTHSETQGDSAATRSFDLDAMGLGPPTKVRRRGKVDKWTRILGVAVVLLLVFNIGVRMGHASRPKAATPAGAGAGAAGAGAGAPGAGAGAAGAGAGAAGRGAQGGAGAGVGADPAKAAASGTVKVIDGNAIYVGLPDGTTKRVVSNESTRYTRTEPGSQRDVQPGDRVVVEGQPQPDGSVNATRVSDYASTLQQP